MILAGLTGSIGMGKSTVGAMFRDLGAAVLDSDAVVHRLYRKGGRAVQPVSELFPEAVIDGAVDRSRLAAAVIGQAEALRRLEAVVHPMVRDEQNRFIETARNQGVLLVILDIPLLFETAAEDRFDHIIVVSTPAGEQRRRVLARPGMTETRFENILAQQLPDSEKRNRADTLIDTSGDLSLTRQKVAEIYQHLTGEKKADA